jgi:hypothetical protein
LGDCQLRFSSVERQIKSVTDIGHRKFLLPSMLIAGMVV